jgi:hypothetical protein
MVARCPPFWLENPSILWQEPFQFFPFTKQDSQCTSSALNSFTRFGFYLGVLIALIRMEWMWLFIGTAFSIFSTIAWFWMEKEGAVRELFGQKQATATATTATTEPFYGQESEGLSRDFISAAPIVDPRDVINEYVPNILGVTSFTQPTAANPFMNVLLTEIADNPYRAPAANVQSKAVSDELNSYFQTMFARDPGDVFNHTQGQRTWITMPSSTVPNDQGAFADWLFRVPGKTCKEGNLSACMFNTGAEALPWRNVQPQT